MRQRLKNRSSVYALREFLTAGLLVVSLFLLVSPMALRVGEWLRSVQDGMEIRTISSVPVQHSYGPVLLGLTAAHLLLLVFYAMPLNADLITSNRVGPGRSWFMTLLYLSNMGIVWYDLIRHLGF